MLSALSRGCVVFVQRYLPSPFVLVLVLTFVAFILAIAWTGQGFMDVTNNWGDGLWSLLKFSMQMALILVTGSALATAPPLRRFLDKVAAKVRTPGQAIVVVTLVALAACWINWGFGLVIGAIMAKTLARNVRGVDYPLLVAAAYSGFLVWHGGLSGSIPLAVATGGEALEKVSAGALTQPIPVSETLFAPLNLTILAFMLVGLPLLNRAMQPKVPTTVDPTLFGTNEEEVFPVETPAQKLDDNIILSLMLVIVGAVFLGAYFFNNGFALTLNVVIMLFLFLGLLAHRTPERYMRSVVNSMEGVAGILLLFPFYAGIMAVMNGVGADGVSLSGQISHAFADSANADSFPILAFLSAGLVNIFVPSGGGQWAVQGPIMMPAGDALNVAPQVTAMAIAWGDAWTNMIQPFWALPLLGIAGLDARAIMGYCLVALLYSGIVISACFYFFV